ncbi:MAG: twin-arginine translocation signal domain-containing protein, partial [Verrucomicrobiales bacterium]
MDSSKSHPNRRTFLKSSSVSAAALIAA